ncbi:putative dehydrogenase [Nitrospirillum amazonense]|uniref:Putative dehydrogenase n=1 Tax=Nitrospirillum amazonense TaxID=28077 RepID=A0A560F132_9PROT|nr:Gfo/Idh/MocA family oxidoreductase [Nitrospirillum amazonense]TWB15348.1 putative dehydrogenase [Nitrospirillum amazonense]
MIGTALCAYGLSGRVFHAPLILAEPALSLQAILRRSGADGTEPVGARVVADFQAILDDPAVELVVVNTPNALHFPMAQAALAAGKHVVLEKPMTITLEEGRHLMAQARAAGRLLAVFHNKRLDAEYLTLGRHLARGDLGRLVEVEWHYDRYRAHVTHKAWKEDEQPGAGTWFDLGVHLVDGMLRQFGRPLSVAAEMRSLRRAEGATDYFDVRFRYADHRVILRSSTYVREPGPVLVAHGDKGSLVIPKGDVQEAQMAAGVKPGDAGWAVVATPALLHTERAGAVVREEVALEAGRYQDFYRNVADALAGQAPLAFGPGPAFEALALVHRAIEAARQPGLSCDIAYE